jgi:HK97 gp10 family phage protein
MMAGHINIEGLDLDQYDADVREAAKRGMEEGLRIIAEAASKNAPRDSGETANSYLQPESVHITDDPIKGLIGQVGSNYFVARLLEHGTVKMKAHPHLFSAAESNEDLLLTLMKESIAEALP